MFTYVLKVLKILDRNKKTSIKYLCMDCYGKSSFYQRWKSSLYLSVYLEHLSYTIYLICDIAKYKKETQRSQTA